MFECVRRSASGQLSALGRQSLGIAAELPADCCDTSDRAKELSAIGAAVAANSRANLEKHIGAARAVGVSARELDDAVRLARAVQRRSAEILAEEATRLLDGPEPVLAEAAPVSAGCVPDCGCGDAVAASVLRVVEAAADFWRLRARLRMRVRSLRRRRGPGAGRCSSGGPGGDGGRVRLRL